MLKEISLHDVNVTPIDLFRQHNSAIFDLLRPLMNSDRATSKGVKLLFASIKAEMKFMPSQPSRVLDWLWDEGQKSEDLQQLITQNLEDSTIINFSKPTNLNRADIDNQSDRERAKTLAFAIVDCRHEIKQLTKEYHRLKSID